jgi:cytoskeleton protein RodZ
VCSVSGMVRCIQRLTAERVLLTGNRPVSHVAHDLLLVSKTVNPAPSAEAASTVSTPLDHKAMDIGKHLREARELRGMTLHQVADSTKLSATTLQCIERNEFNRLPGGIFAKGHLRAYAAAVGVESDEVVHEYLSQFPAATEELSFVREVPAVEQAHAGRHLLLTVAGIVVALVAYGLIHESVEWSDSPPPRLSEPPALIESVGTERSGLGRLTATERDEPGLGLEIQPAGACWLSAMADGHVVIYRLLQSGERVTIVARNDLVLRVGDPALFSYKLNGVSGRSLGEAGQPVTVTITVKNFQTFLAGSAPETRRAMSRM